MTLPGPAPTRPELPEALLRPRRRWPYLWLLPLLSLALALWLAFNTLSQRGLSIEIRFQQGYGLKPGDALRYRGITVGTVQDVRLAVDLAGVAATVRVDNSAKELTRAESLFWIVRPQLDIGGISGLDTVVGANYIRVSPGQGDYQTTFAGLEEAPFVEVMDLSGLEITLTTPNKGNLRPGAPISYRQVAIGTILTVDLARDASAVEAKAFIKPDYVALIREHTRFWKISGARFSAGLGGLTFNVDSVPSLILGGVSLAIPPEPGERVAQRHLFTLYDKPEQEWLEWIPGLSLYDDADNVRERPRLLLANLTWEHKSFLFLTRENQRRGWVLPVRNGFLGPLDLLTPPTDAVAGSARLTLADRPLALGALPAKATNLTLLPHEHSYPSWTSLRPMIAPENALVIADPDTAARFVPASRYQIRDGEWFLDPALPFDSSWHGAALVAESDGAVIGILLVMDDRVTVARPP